MFSRSKLLALEVRGRAQPGLHDLGTPCNELGHYPMHVASSCVLLHLVVREPEDGKLHIPYVAALSQE
eukprot:341708-Alexandrium_andersonii.AAC.1